MKLPRHLQVLLAVYLVSSLAHFTHNAEFIALYPNMPAWITREQVYLVWLAITGVGVAGLVLLRWGWPAAGAGLLAAYGALGLDGLGHYTLALCSEHTWAMNLTIWSEVVSGFVLALCAATLAGRLARARWHGARGLQRIHGTNA